MKKIKERKLYKKIKWIAFKKWQKKLIKPYFNGYCDFYMLLDLIEDWCTQYGIYEHEFGYTLNHNRYKPHELWTLRKKIRSYKGLENRLYDEEDKVKHEILGEYQCCEFSYDSDRGGVIRRTTYIGYNPDLIVDYFNNHREEITEYYSHYTSRWHGLYYGSECYQNELSLKEDLYNADIKITEESSEFQSWIATRKPDELWGKNFTSVRDRVKSIYGDITNVFYTPNDVIRYVEHKVRLDRYRYEECMRKKLLKDIFDYMTEDIYRISDYQRISEPISYGKETDNSAELEYLSNLSEYDKKWTIPPEFKSPRCLYWWD